MALIGSLLVSLSAKTDDLERGMQKARAEVGATSKAVASAQVSFEGLGTSLAGLAAGVVSLSALKNAVEGVVSAGQKLQQLTTAFTIITGSSQGAGQALATVRKTSDQLGASFTDLAEAYKGIVAASKGTQLEGAKTTEIFQNIVSAGTALQLSQEGIRGILLAVQQIMSKGTIQAQDFKLQIGERLPGAVNILGRAMNMTGAEITKAMEAGDIPAARLLDFARQLQVELGSKAEASAHLLTNEWGRMKNALFELGVALDQLGASATLAKLLRIAQMSVEGWTIAAQKVQQIATGPQLPEVTALQAQFPTAKIAGTPQAAALQETVKQLNEAQAAAQRAQEAVAAFGDTDSIARRSAQVAAKQTEADVTRLNQQYQEQFEALRNIGDTSQRLAEIRERTAQAITADPTLDPDRGQKATDLAKELQQRFDELSKTLGRLDERATLNPNSRLEILKEGIQELEKVIKSTEDTLARNKTLVPLLTGQGGAGLSTSLFPRANAAGMAAAFPLIQSQAGKYGLDPTLVAAVAFQESRFNPAAVSSAGAQGLMQLMPKTAAGLGVQDPFDLQQNLTGGMKYLQQLLAQFNGDMSLALAAYNAGPGRVIQAGYKIPAIPETQAYVRDVLTRQAALSGGGGLVATGAPGTGVTAQLAQLQQILQQKQLQILDIANFDKGIERLGRFLAQYDQLRLTAADFEATEVDRLNKQSQLRQDLQKQFAQDPVKAQLALTQQLAAAQEQVGQQWASNTLREMRTDQARQIDEIVKGLIDENRTLGLSKEAIQQYVLEANNATDADKQRVIELQNIQVALLAERDAAETRAQQVGDIESMVKALADERDNILLTNDALVQKRLALAQAGEGQRALVESLQETVKASRAASQAADFLENTFFNLVTGAKVDFKSLAQEFGRMVLSILADAAGLRQALTGVAKAGIDWVGTALGLGRSALGIAGGVASAAEASSAVAQLGSGAQSLPLATVDEAGNVFTGFEPRATGGPVWAGTGYLVGENGPERFTPTSNGYITPGAMSARFAQVGTGQGPSNARPIQVNFYISGQDASTFTSPRSQGEVQSRIVRTLQEAQRRVA